MHSLYKCSSMCIVYVNTIHNHNNDIPKSCTALHIYKNRTVHFLLSFYMRVCVWVRGIYEQKAYESALSNSSFVFKNGPH